MYACTDMCMCVHICMSVCVCVSVWVRLCVCVYGAWIDMQVKGLPIYTAELMCIA